MRQRCRYHRRAVSECLNECASEGHSVGMSGPSVARSPCRGNLQRQSGGAPCRLRIVCAICTAWGAKAKAHLSLRCPPWGPSASPRAFVFVERHASPGDSAQLLAWPSARGWCAAIGRGRLSPLAGNRSSGGVMIVWRAHMQARPVHEAAVSAFGSPSDPTGLSPP